MMGSHLALETFLSFIISMNEFTHAVNGASFSGLFLSTEGLFDVLDDDRDFLLNCLGGGGIGDGGGTGACHVARREKVNAFCTQVTCAVFFEGVCGGGKRPVMMSNHVDIVSSRPSLGGGVSDQGRTKRRTGACDSFQTS
eukprot:GHVO01023771.1.p2 GENE.GHVO01023771.1~~GHVO01023771.1.p2  ORF type:complete len:140 (+),score=26.48 GHVO01023771.1:497-916(+)